MHWGKGEGNLSSNISETQHEFRSALNLEETEGVFICPNLSEAFLFRPFKFLALSKS